MRKFKEELDSEAVVRNKEYDDQKIQLEEQQKAELAGKGVDVNLLNQYRKAIDDLKKLLE